MSTLHSEYTVQSLLQPRLQLIARKITAFIATFGCSSHRVLSTRIHCSDFAYLSQLQQQTMCTLIFMMSVTTSSSSQSAVAASISQ